MFVSQQEVEVYLTPPYDDEPYATIDTALRLWAHITLSRPDVRGYASFDSTCRDAKSSDQWRETDEVLEEREHGWQVRAVEGAVDSLTDPLHVAVIDHVYRNTVGPAVWRNGRLKGRSKEEVKRLHRDAMQALAPLLRKRGLVI